MKKKILISFVIIFIIFSFIAVNNAFAVDDFMNKVLTQMDTSKVGITTESTFTKVIRTIYAIVQIVVIGGAIAYFTWHSTKFFSSDPSERKKAKEALPYRLLALVVILALDGIVTIIAKYLTP